MESARNKRFQSEKKKGVKGGWGERGEQGKMPAFFLFLVFKTKATPESEKGN